MRNRVLVFASAVLCASNIPANAISWNTQMSCASDYYAYCSKHVAGSAGCHACMRTNRTKLSNACVSALIDDGVLPKAAAAKQKTKTAIRKSKPTERLAAKPVAKPPSVAAAAAKPAPEAASPVENASPVESAVPTTPPEAASLPEAVARAPEPPAETPPQQVEAAPGIDQQTFEAMKNRAPFFVATPETLMFEETAANSPPQTPYVPR